MTVGKLLVANRGEVAVRVLRTAAEMGIAAVAVYAPEDAAGLHVELAGEARALAGSGAAAYLDAAGIVEVARELGCDAIHPGWGFLAESAEFARLCEEAGIIFVGPSPAALSALGDKAEARRLAARHEVPVLRGSEGSVSAAEARDFLEGLGPGAAIAIKALHGGGGRGMRIVSDPAAVEAQYARCRSEAERAFGDGALYVEERMAPARHIEIQVVGDGSGQAVHLWERDCSLQRRHQKVVEIAPSPVLSGWLRERLTSDAVRMASALSYRGLGTFEFLVDARSAGASDGRYAFIEANPRLQVEHTVTEEIFGLDLVAVQLQLAGGARLEDLGLVQDAIPAPRGMAMQLRVNAETIGPDGLVQPSSGTLAVFQPPAGPGVRVDSAARTGMAVSSAFDSLLAKLVVLHPGGRLAEVVARAERALREFRVEGVATNLGLLENLVEHPGFRSSQVTTTFLDDEIGVLARERPSRATTRSAQPALSGHTAGARVDVADPLAVLDYGRQRAPRRAVSMVVAAPGAVLAPMQSTVVSFEVQVGDRVRQGQEVAVVSAMKMEHVLHAPAAGIVRELNASPGDTVVEGQLLVVIEPSEGEDADERALEDVDLDHIRPDLAQIVERHEKRLDEARPASVARRRESGHRTVRENIADLVDPGSWLEYGPLVLAIDSRLKGDVLLDKGAADGMITGIASINGDAFPDPANRCMVIAYDYMVMAGTQGARNHAKTDRAIAVAQQARLPVVLFSEGGGGRASGGGGAGAGGAGSTRTFAHFAHLSGLVPLVGINTGRCFAGNASLLGCCDVIIATADSNIGMGGPAMIEGGGLGVFAPEEIGPMEIQVPNGVVDVLVKDDEEAVQVGRQYLSYFQGRLSSWEAPDQRRMRQVVPENRLRAYDIRRAIETLADVGSCLELRRGFDEGMITALIRVEGWPVGVIANDPSHLGGAITSGGSDKAARFLQICDAFDIPILAFCDTPGMMVGPEVEKTALVRHCSRLFVIGANLSVPYFTVITRKAYGLGAIAMAAGSYKEPLFSVSWPTGEFGGMGLEGQVKLAYRNELAAIEGVEERRKWFDEMVARAYERGKALNEAVIFGLDDTIDPADTRSWLATLLSSVRRDPRPAGKKRAAIDAW